MVKDLEITAKEKFFLNSMDLRNSDESDKYKEKYGCDPCDACGPSSCSDCNGCAENVVVSSNLNPFKDYKLN